MMKKTVLNSILIGLVTAVVGYMTELAFTHGSPVRGEFPPVDSWALYQYAPAEYFIDGDID